MTLAGMNVPFDVLFRHSPNAYMVVDRGLRYLDANQAYERIWGYPLAKAYADPTAYLQNVHPDDRAIAESGFKRQLAVEETHLEFRIIRPDGEMRWIHEHCVPIRDAQGQIERLVGTFSDITARKLSDAKIRESEERFQLLAKATNDAIWDWNLTNSTL